VRVGDLVKLVVPCMDFSVGVLLSLSQPVGLSKPWASKPIATVVWACAAGKRQHLPEQLEVVSERR